MKTRHHVAIQMEEEQQWEKDNGPIVKTADQLWKYSGETEELNEDFKALLGEMDASKIKAKKLPVKSRKEYFRKYWKEYKLNQI